MSSRAADAWVCIDRAHLSVPTTYFQRAGAFLAFDRQHMRAGAAGSTALAAARSPTGGAVGREVPCGMSYAQKLHGCRQRRGSTFRPLGLGVRLVSSVVARWARTFPGKTAVGWRSRSP